MDFSEEHVSSIFRVEERAKQETSTKQAASCTSSFLVLFFDPEDKSEIFLRNVGCKSYIVYNTLFFTVFDNEY
jgi:hypothetical protein